MKRDVQEFGGRFTILEALRDDSQREGLDARQASSRPAPINTLAAR